MFVTVIGRGHSGTRGWKLPETTLCYPWIRRMFPDVRYVFWIRNPRDCILGRHMTDDLGRWGIGCPPTEDDRLRRAYSWIYQYRLVKAVPRPKHWIEIRFEDFVLDQENVLGRIGDFLGIPLSRIAVNPDAVGRYRTDHGRNHHDFFEPAMREYGYAIPDPNDPARAPAASPMAPSPRHASTARECPPADAAEPLPLRVFEDVPIMPYTDLPHGRNRAAILHRGGPVWPDWDRQTEARHRRKGEPVDVPPDIAPPEEVWDERVAWAGAIVDHFGHQIAEFSCRLLPTLAVNPATVFAFAVRPGDGIDSRRPRHAIGKHFVPERARSLTHLDFGVRLVHGLTPDGTVAGAGALPVVDEGRLIDGFEAIDIPLGRQWDSSRYREACERDAESWLHWFCGTPRLFLPGAAAAVRESLVAAGFAHMVPRVEAAIGHGRPARWSDARARRPPS